MISKLYSKIAIYIPAQFSDAIRQTAEVFTMKFGGCSLINLKGFWRNGRNELEEEDVVMIYSFTDLEDGKLKEFGVLQGKKLAKRLGQEAVAIEINNEMYLVS